MASRKKKKSEKPTVQLSEPMQRCMSILKHLQEKEEARPFLEPVDWELYGLPDYPEVIKKPMDLGTIQSNLETGKYPNVDKFAADVRLVWKNAMLYNQPGSDIYSTAEKLSKAFERKMSKLKQSKKTSTKKGAAKEATRGDRVKFSELVHELNGEQLAEVVDMIQKFCPDALTEVDEEELEIEINALDSNTLFDLNAYATEASSGAAGKKRKR